MYDVRVHPCFSDTCVGAARLHLPVAPHCNIQCRYCSRRYDCANECRPGVCSRVLSAEEAVQVFLVARERLPKLTVVGIAGPGEALADFSAVQKTLAAIRQRDSAVQFCLSTNGLCLSEYLPQLLALGVGYLTVTVNAVTPVIGAEFYEYVYRGTERLQGEDAFFYLSAQQWAGIQAAVHQGICCKINTVVVPRLNERDVLRIAQRAAQCGCFMQNLIPLIPVAGTAFADRPAAPGKLLHTLRTICSGYLRQMQHCQHCRADAAGPLGNDLTAALFG